MNQDTNVNAIIAHVTTDFEKAYQAGRIDEDRLYDDAVRALKTFGNSITMPCREIISVQGGRALMPVNFARCIYVEACDPLAYKTTAPQNILLSSTIHKERIEVSSEWSDCEACCEVKGEKYIKEEITLDLGSIEYVYQNRRPMFPSKFNKFSENFEPDCANKRLRKENTYGEFSINGRYMKTDFNQGSVHLIYQGYPTDFEGNIEIPNTFNDHLYRYMVAHLKRLTAHRLILNDDASQGIINMYQELSVEEKRTLIEALNEVKMRKLTPQHLRRLQTRNRLETYQYSVSDLN